MGVAYLTVDSAEHRGPIASAALACCGWGPKRTRSPFWTLRRCRPPSHPFYEPLDEPREFWLDGRMMLRFASSRWDALCLDPATGHIMSVPSLVPPGQPERWQPPRLLNSTIAAFKACVETAAAAVRRPASNERENWSDEDWDKNINNLDALSSTLRT